MGLGLTQQELFRCHSPAEVMDLVGNRASVRKLRLFICACAYHALRYNYWEDAYEILDTIHKYADGWLVDVKTLRSISIAGSDIGQLRHWFNIVGWSNDHLKASYIRSELLSDASSSPYQMGILMDILGGGDCEVAYDTIPQNVEDLALVTYNSHHVVPDKMCVRDVATYRETIDGCCHSYGNLQKCECMDKACPDNLLDPHGMILIADMLEEHGIEDRALLGHLREHTRKVVHTFTPSFTCVKCGRRGVRRHGIHFDHEFRCGKCNYSWEPGKQVSEIIEVPAYHYKGCWALDKILGRG